MAIRAAAKRGSDIARLFVGPRSVALLARDLSMQVRERIVRERMIELADADRLPVAGVVTLQAIRPEPTVVLVLMTGSAGWRDSKKCPSRILDLDVRAFVPGY